MESRFQDCYPIARLIVVETGNFLSALDQDVLDGTIESSDVFEESGPSLEWSVNYIVIPSWITVMECIDFRGFILE